MTVTTGHGADKSRGRWPKAELYLPLMLPVLLLFNKVLADAAVVIIGLLFLYRAFRLGDWDWAQTPWFRFGLLFWLYLLIVNVPLSVDPGGSLFKAVAFMRWPLFAAALGYWLFDNPAQQKRFLMSLLVISLFIVVDTGWQFLHGQDFFGIEKFSSNRLTGPFQKPVPGIMMLRVFFILLYGVVLFRALRSSGRQGVGTLLLVIIGTLFVFITGERMAFLLFITGSVVVIAGFLLDNPRHNLLLMSGAATLALLTFLVMLAEPETAHRTVYSIVDKLSHFRESDYGLVFQSAVDVWHRYPIVGSGLDTYRAVCTDMQLLAQTGMECTHAHNLYLQIASETGLVGLMLFSVFIVALFHAALKPFVRERQWFMGALAFTVLYVCFWPLMGGISILNNWVAALVWTGAGWTLAMARRQSRSGKQESHPELSSGSI